MKKLLSILFLLITLTLTSQTVTYQSSNTIITNPEKGFYRYTSTGSSGGYNLLSTSTLSGYRTNENITVIYRQFFLRDFITGIPITSTYLTNMQTDFNRIRSAGAKVIVRFSYTSSSRSVYQPTKNQILAHIAQVAPVLNSNKDVIVCIQAGWIGRWGEWYYTGSTEFGDKGSVSTTQWATRKEIMDAMVNQFPVEIPLQVRYVGAKQKMYGNTFIGRIGFYNDSFLGTWGDSGTFTVNNSGGTPTQAEIDYWRLHTINLPVSGESNMINSPRTLCPNALVELDRFNWSVINKDYFPTVISDWQTSGCFTTIQRSIGYDFKLNNSTLSNGILTINIGNYGYANLFKDRKAFLVCKNTSTNINYSFEIDSNIKRIINTNYNMSINLNLLSLPAGNYKLFLNLPDPLINNRLYSIQTSNLNTWTSEGFNDLFLTYTRPTINIINNKIVTSSKDVVKIYNTFGNLVSTNPDLSILKNGVYIIVLETPEIVLTKKIVL